MSLYERIRETSVEDLLVLWSFFGDVKLRRWYYDLLDVIAGELEQRGAVFDDIRVLCPYCQRRAAWAAQLVPGYSCANCSAVFRTSLPTRDPAAS